MPPSAAAAGALAPSAARLSGSAPAAAHATTSSSRSSLSSCGSSTSAATSASRSMRNDFASDLRKLRGLRLRAYTGPGSSSDAAGVSTRA